MKDLLPVPANGTRAWPALARLFRRDLGDLLGEEWSLAPLRDSLMEGAFQPSIDVTEDKDRYTVKAELPGMSKDDIKISMENGILSIQGEKKEEKETREGGRLRSERSYGSFYRAFNLPAGVDAAKAQASYKDGVLVLELPKKEEAKPKAIEISVK